MLEYRDVPRGHKAEWYLQIPLHSQDVTSALSSQQVFLQEEFSEKIDHLILPSEFHLTLALFCEEDQGSEEVLSTMREQGPHLLDSIRPVKLKLLGLKLNKQYRIVHSCLTPSSSDSISSLVHSHLSPGLKVYQPSRLHASIARLKSPFSTGDKWDELDNFCQSAALQCEERDPQLWLCKSGLPRQEGLVEKWS